MSQVPADRMRDIVGRLPTTRDEDWKYTDLGRARDISARWLDAGAGTPAAFPRRRDRCGDRCDNGVDRRHLVVIFENGELHRLHEGDGFIAEQLRDVPAADSALAELNAALLADGLRLIA